MSLSREERERILADERARREARQTLDAEERKEGSDRIKAGCAGCLTAVGALFVLALFVGAFFNGAGQPDDSSSSSSGSAMTKSDSAAVAEAQAVYVAARLEGVLVSFEPEASEAVVGARFYSLTAKEKRMVGKGLSTLITKSAERVIQIKFKDEMTGKVVYRFDGLGMKKVN